jgi:hypothetical protein
MGLLMETRGGKRKEKETVGGGGLRTGMGAGIWSGKGHESWLLKWKGKEKT